MTAVIKGTLTASFTHHLVSLQYTRNKAGSHFIQCTMYVSDYLCDAHVLMDVHKMEFTSQ